jgi:hypothetical protein
MKVIDPAILAGTRVRARYCEGEHCCDPEGATRIYALLAVSRAARVILCRPSWEQENRYRLERGKELGRPEHWPTRHWDAAERYQPAATNPAPSQGEQNETASPPLLQRQRCNASANEPKKTMSLLPYAENERRTPRASRTHAAYLAANF